jgi:hypothetical protein
MRFSGSEGVLLCWELLNFDVVDDEERSEPASVSFRHRQACVAFCEGCSIINSLFCTKLFRIVFSIMAALVHLIIGFPLPMIG